jgi:hypothetical protein
MSAASGNPSSVKFSTHEKAQQINLDNSFYGTFAEIGAGQEVARWFFRVGGASGTVAKSMSAYDMTFSDAIYGPAERYVSQERLLEMLEHEYYLLKERLSVKRGSNTRFFVFANTVVAKGYSTPRECHAWTGLNLQMTPDGPVNQMILHYRLLDSDSLAQQEAIGIMGVNLIYAGYMYWDNLDLLLASLKDNIAPDRIEIDMFKMSGPDLERHDNRVASLKMVQQGISNAALFSPEGEILQPSDTFYKKSILLERGFFRPVTKVNIDMMEKGRARFLQEPLLEASRPIEVMEITMRNLLAMGCLDPDDFLARVDCIGAMNKYVLISDIGEFYRLQHYLERYTQHMIGIVIGQPLLKEIFNEKYYENLPGGILESFGRLFKNRLKVYVYPSVDEKSGRPLTASDLDLPHHLHHLHLHLMDNHYLVDLPTPSKPLPYHPSKVISDKIRTGDESWKEFVPPKVVDLIVEKGFFGLGSEQQR